MILRKASTAQMPPLLTPEQEGRAQATMEKLAAKYAEGPNSFAESYLARQEEMQREKQRLEEARAGLQEEDLKSLDQPDQQPSIDQPPASST